MKTAPTRKPNIFRPIALLLCALVFLTACGGKKTEAPLLEIIFLDVGQGDCVLFRTDQGDVLIDAGPEYAQQELCLRLSELGVNELMLAVFTHPDEDHIGGADGVLSEIPTREVWIPDVPMTEDGAKRLLEVAQERKVPVRTVAMGDYVKIGQTLFNVLAPAPGEVIGDANNASLILKIFCGDVSALFTGDAEAEEEARLLKEFGASQLSCDLYKVGHHGSATSSTPELVNAMKPRYAVISCEAGNTYGHPHGEVLDRLKKVGAKVYRTDRNGELRFFTDGKTLTAP